MISFHEKPTKTTMQGDHDNSSKKRKLDDSPFVAGGAISEEQLKTKNARSLLESPSPHWEWQRYLDIKVSFYNARTRKNSPIDINYQPELLNPNGMSLELKLNNLPCSGSVLKENGDSNSCHELHSFGDLIRSNSRKDEKTNNDGHKHSPSWLTFEADEKEMVTAVCNKCHMLVMMCKSSPACPNCKFVHPLDQKLPTLFTPKVKPLVFRESLQLCNQN